MKNTISKMKKTMKVLMRVRGKTQRSIAKDACVDEGLFSAFLSGKKSIGLQSFFNIINALDARVMIEGTQDGEMCDGRCFKED